MMASIMGNEFFKTDVLPTFWCAGCGNGLLLGALIRSLHECRLSKVNTVVVTGIGCWGKADDYLTTHAFHGTHGRAIPIATGIKIANPTLDVIVLVGDGDGVTIGGNHLIHAARRNIDITVIMSNNCNYGMTGGQYSGTTPCGSITSTSRYGHVEDGFDVAQLVSTAGAGYVAKGTVANPKQLQRFISTAINKKSGFRFIEAINICPTYFGKSNKIGLAPEMLKMLKTKTITKQQAARMTEEELADKIVVGEYVNKNVDGYIARYYEIQHCAKGI